jgi:hypothetical protein
MLTTKTIESFLRYNNRDNYDIFYGDDASEDPTIHELMRKHNIPCLMKHDTRKGCSPSTDELIQKVCNKNDNKYILYLQNDFESLRPIPLDIVKQIMETMPEIGWVRLWGKRNNDRKINQPDRLEPGWTPLKIGSEQLEVGRYIYPYCPMISRRDILSQSVRGAARERDTRRAGIKTGLKTIRFTRNIVNHIGFDIQTPGGEYGDGGINIRIHKRRLVRRAKRRCP